MSRLESDYLNDILDELVFLEKHSIGLSIDSLIADEVLTRAFERSFQIIGEATKQVSTITRTNYPNIEWSSMTKFRDRLVHHYFDTDYVILLEIVTTKVPPLRKEMQELLNKENLK